MSKRCSFKSRRLLTTSVLHHQTKQSTPMPGPQHTPTNILAPSQLKLNAPKRLPAATLPIFSINQHFLMLPLAKRHSRMITLQMPLQRLARKGMIESTSSVNVEFITSSTPTTRPLVEISTECWSHLDSSKSSQSLAGTFVSMSTNPPGP